jgi:AmmeMemoRadiSam system protein B
MTRPRLQKLVRPPAVAGMFYPGEPEVLRRDVDELLRLAPPVSVAPKALIAPHAGYAYSGPVAATAYAALSSIAEQITRVVLLGPAHRVALSGLALPEADVFDTPLGPIEIDADAVARLGDVARRADAHAREHSLEVHLPFLMRALRRRDGTVGFKLVPLVVGHASPQEVASVLERLWGGPETLIVVSSDLSHFLPYETARRVDHDTVSRILALDGHRLAGDEACGAYPINGLLEVARARGLTPELLDLRNSGDTAGPRREVVGYAAIAFHEPGGDVENRAQPGDRGS